MYHWTVHEKVDFPKFPPDTWLGGYIPQLLILHSEMKLKNFHMFVSGGWGGGVYSTTCHLELRNEIFTLISFMHLKNFQTVTTCFTAKNAKMQKYTTVPTCFTAKNYPK